MESAAVTAATLPMKPLLAKLTAFLGGGQSTLPEGIQGDDIEIAIAKLGFMNSILEQICECERAAAAAGALDLGSGHTLPEGSQTIGLQVLIAKLESMDTLLHAIWEREDLDAPYKKLTMEMLELWYDMEDAVDDFTHRRTNTSLSGQLEMIVEDFSERFCAKWKAAEMAISASSTKPAAVDPRARFLHKDASELVGMDQLKDELLELLLVQPGDSSARSIGTLHPHRRKVVIKVQMASDEQRSKAIGLVGAMDGVESVALAGDGRDWLVVVGHGINSYRVTAELRRNVGHAEELVQLHHGAKKPTAHDDGHQQRSDGLKMVCIVGLSGAGKTALADLLFHAAEEQFQCRAFVWFSRSSSSITDTLRAILTQVTTNWPYAGTEAVSEQDLIDKILNFLVDKRYLIIVDDIWHWKEWGIIKKSLPKNNLSSRIIITTRRNDIVERCRTDDIDAFVYDVGVLEPWDAWKLSDMTIMKSAGSRLILIGDDKIRLRIVKMCYGPYGMPLALICISSALVEQIKDLDGEFNYEKALRHLEGGISNIKCLKPLTESLCLGYDDLPVHLRTFLLYCTMYHRRRGFERDSLVGKMIAEGLDFKKEVVQGFFDKLVKKGWIRLEGLMEYRIHPMMLEFLRRKLQEDNFITSFGSGSHISSSSCSTRIQRLSLQPGHSVDFSGLDLLHTRCLVVFDDASATPFKRFERLRVLDLEGCGDLEDDHVVDICGLIWLRYLGLKGTPIRMLPPEITGLQHLKTLDISDTKIEDLPQEIGALQHLETLNLSSTWVTKLPSEIGGLQHLETLILYKTSVSELPPEIRGLQHLKTLGIRSTGVRDLSLEISDTVSSVDSEHKKHRSQRASTGNWEAAAASEDPDLSNKRVSKLPSETGRLQQHPKTPDSSNTRVSELSFEIDRQQQHSKNPGIINTSIPVLPPEIGRLQHLQVLDLSNTGISELPPEFGRLQHLEVLNLSNTRIAVLPPEFGRLQHLQVLDLSNTGISELPPEIGRLQHLQTLNFSNTEIRELPPEIGMLPLLEALYMRNTAVSELPLELWELQGLRFLDITNTMVSELPWEALEILKSGHVIAGDEHVRLPEDVLQVPPEHREVLSIGVLDYFGMETYPPHAVVVKVRTTHMRIPQFIRDHFEALYSLDITLCRLEKDDGNLRFLQQMPNLQTLVLRLEVLSTEPVAISSEGFARLESFYLDSRMPQVTFEPGAMPNLKLIVFRFYNGPASKDAVGITHLRSLEKVVFRCFKWYKRDNPGISATIGVVREEAKKHPRRITLCIEDKEEVFPEECAEFS